MLKIIRRSAIGILITMTFTCAHADDLLQIYQLALKNDPTFRAAEAQYMSDKQNIGIARAALLPSLDLSAAYNRSYNNTNLNGNFYDTTQQYGVSLSQPLFNLAGWQAVKNAKATVKASQATFNAALQTLIFNTAQAYFNVLQAYDDLRFSLAEQRALARQLQQNEERFKVGLIAITDVQQTRAQYDSVSAQVITDRNNIANRLEELREITGEFNNQLAGLKDNLPLVKPDPANINQWVDTAIRQNYNLLAARFSSEAAQDNISVQSSARWPVVSLNGSFTNSRDKNPGNNSLARTNNNAAVAGVAVSFPVVQGGLVGANTRQAIYQYAQASANAETTYRSTVANTRKSYLGVISGIAVIQADKQAVISNESALKATEASYIVGTQTMFDVLNAQSNLYEAQKNLASDQYSYLLNTLSLKQAAGTLSVHDLSIINSWLGKNIDFSKYDSRNYEPSYSYSRPKKLSSSSSYSQQKSATKSTQQKPKTKSINHNATPKTGTNKPNQTKTLSHKTSTKQPQASNNAAPAQQVSLPVPMKTNTKA